jgi:aryl-alcohol dehydrogenase-like predicted oxidoreductase
MNYRTLGKTGIKISELGIGGGMFHHYSKQGVDDAKIIIDRAIDLGINYIDTAPAYGDSEKVIGEVFNTEKRDCVLSTKLGGKPVPFDPRDKGTLRRSIDESLRLLGRDSIDVLFIHEPDRPQQYDWFDDRNNLHGPVTELIEELKAEGIIKFAGIAGTTVYEMMNLVRTGLFDVLLTAFNSSLLWQESLRFLIPEAKKMDMGVVVGSPLQHGALACLYPDEIENNAPWLSLPRRKQFKKLYEYVNDLKIPVSVLGLRYMISNKDISSVLMGVGSISELEENAGTIDAGPLDEEIISRINEIADLVPFRPYEEPYKLPFGTDYAGPGHIGKL